MLDSRKLKSKKLQNFPFTNILRAFICCMHCDSPMKDYHMWFIQNEFAFVFEGTPRPTQFRKYIVREKKIRSCLFSETLGSFTKLNMTQTTKYLKILPHINHFLHTLVIKFLSLRPLAEINFLDLSIYYRQYSIVEKSQTMGAEGPSFRPSFKKKNMPNFLSPSASELRKVMLIQVNWYMYIMKRYVSLLKP